MDEQEQILQDAFLALPQVLQEAITNADVQANMRKLAEVHKLHLDKWNILENDIMLALLGISDINELPENISTHINIPLEQAQQITNSVAEIVFDPIQDELKLEVGESRSTLENIDYQKQKGPIDISKFSPAPSDPVQYKPRTTKKYADNNDPYHEPIE